jgi:hypothetical protein
LPKPHGRAISRATTEALLKGSITLAQVAVKTTMLDIACSRCDRRGRLNVQKLIAEYGAGADLPTLKEKLAHGCPRLESTSIHERCGAHFPRLPELF